ncbi:hypothetical protein NEIRO03_2545, partial [Nematocida sp. AWRm78]
DTRVRLTLVHRTQLRTRSGVRFNDVVVGSRRIRFLVPASGSPLAGLWTAVGSGGASGLMLRLGATPRRSGRRPFFVSWSNVLPGSCLITGINSGGGQPGSSADLSSFLALPCPTSSDSLRILQLSLVLNSLIVFCSILFIAIGMGVVLVGLPSQPGGLGLEAPCPLGGD